MRTLLLSIALLAPAAAFADNPKPAPAAPTTTKMESSDCAKARAAGKTCVLNIEEEGILGEHVTTGEENITALNWQSMTSLITVRENFVPEMLRSAEELD